MVFIHFFLKTCFKINRSSYISNFVKKDRDFNFFYHQEGDIEEKDLSTIEYVWTLIHTSRLHKITSSQQITAITALIPTYYTLTSTSPDSKIPPDSDDPNLPVFYFAGLLTRKTICTSIPPLLWNSILWVGFVIYTMNVQSKPSS